MTEYAAKRNPKRCPTHPGELLRDDILPALGLGKSGVAEALGISRQHLYDILREKKPVSPEVAARLGKAFGRIDKADDLTLRCGGGARGILVSSTARDAVLAGSLAAPLLRRRYLTACVSCTNHQLMT